MNYFNEQKSKNWRNQSINNWIRELFKISDNEEIFIDNLNQFVSYINEISKFIGNIDFLSDDIDFDKLTAENIENYFDICQKIERNYRKLITILYPCSGWYSQIIKKSDINDIKCISDEIESFCQYYWASKPIGFKLCEDN